MLPGRTKVEGDTLRATEARERERAEIQVRLATLDEQSARPLRAIIAGTATDEDKEKLSKLEAESKRLRDRLNELK